MPENYKEIKSCEVCGNQELHTVLDLGRHPMCDDLVPIGNMRSCKQYPIEILFCSNCKTAHQRFQIPKEELFPSNYHYRSRFTADVLDGMKKLVESCSEKFDALNDLKVLDIGCNDGSLLDFFAERGATTLGIEPTKAYLDAQNKGHKVYNDFLSETIAENILSVHGKPDIITFTNVFAHIENLNEVLRCVKTLLSENTLLVIENHYLGSVLKENQFDTFYHEHPRTYSFTSFTFMAKTLQIPIFSVEFPSRYGGNIRVFLGNPKRTLTQQKLNLEELKIRENDFSIEFQRLNANVKKWKVLKSKSLQIEVEKYGKLRAKAFPGRAAILIKLLNLDAEQISAVYEKPGSMKIGHYLPGTRIPIISDEELFSEGDKTLPVLNLAWHIKDEIKEYMIKNEYTGNIIDIINENDFAI